MGKSIKKQKIQPQPAAAGGRQLCLRPFVRAGLIFALAAAMSAAAASKSAAPETALSKPALSKPAPSKPDLSETAPKEDKKKHSVSFSGSLGEDFLMERVMVFFAAFGFSYKITKALSLSAESGYRHPLDWIGDPRNPYYGWTNLALSASLSIEALKGFLGSEWSVSAGAGLPLSAVIYKAGKYGSFSASLSQSKPLIPKKLSLKLKHSVFSGFFRYRSDKSGSPHTPAAISHTASLSFQPAKRLRVSGSISPRYGFYIADMDSDPKGYKPKWRFRGVWSGGFGASYEIWPKYKLRAMAQASMEAPTVSPLLTGYPPLNLRYYVYSFGLSGGI